MIGIADISNINVIGIADIIDGALHKHSLHINSLAASGIFPVLALPTHTVVPILMTKLLRRLQQSMRLVMRTACTTPTTHKYKD